MKFSVPLILFLTTVATALPSFEVERSTSFNATVLACKALKLAYSTQVFFPGETNYTSENERESPQTQA